MPNLAVVPTAAVQSFDAEVEEGTIVKRAIRHTVVPSYQSLSISALDIERRRTLNSVSVAIGSVSENLPYFVKHKSIQTPEFNQNVEFTASQLLLADPPKAPIGTVTLTNDEPLAGQRLRSGDLHRLKVYARGDRLDLFQIIFRFRALAGSRVYEKKVNSGLVNLISGTDPTTGEESLTGTILIYSTDLVVNSQQEFVFELELDDGLGYRTGVIATGSFTVFPDSPP